MIIEEKDFRLIPIKETSNLFDLELLKTVNKGKSTERQEFKNVAYGVTIESAIKYNDQKTSLLFSLIHLYAKKYDGAIKWFDRYLELQDPLKTEGIFVLVVDLITSGVLGNEGTTKFLNKINEWTRELDKIDHIYNMSSVINKKRTLKVL